MGELERRPNAWALTPLVVFLLTYLVVSIVAGDFYKMPITVAFVISSIVAIAISKGGKLSNRIEQFCRGAANSNIMLMVLIFILAGAFAQTAKAMGAVDATVNLAMSILPGNLLAAGIFLAACFISISVGTSVGTIVALAPVAVGIADKTGMPDALMLGVVVSGAMFGDNLSMISDTTIAATRGCGCEMRDKFKMNGVIAAVAAVLAMVIYTVVGSAAELTGDFSYEFIKVIPYIFILVFALTGCNVFILLLAGIGVAGAIGFATGSFDIPGFAQAMSSGMSGMYDICLIALLLRGVGGVAEELGAIDWLVKKMHASVKTRKGAEYMTAGMVSVFDAAMANNTIAIMMAAPLVRKVVAEHNVAPKRAASILDIFSCVVQGIIPHGGQILLCVSLTGLSPFSIIGANYYCFLLALVALATIQFGLGRTKEEKEGIRMYDENDEVVALK